MSTITKKQHYVWAYLLRGWEVDGAVWCHLNRENKLFRTNSLSLANETFFYRAQELTEGDLAALEILITRGGSQELQHLNRGWIEGNQACFALRRAVELADLEETARAEALADLETHEKTAVERYHTRVENNFQTGLGQLREGRSDFYADPSARNAFVTYLSFQYFRTANMRKRMLAARGPIGDYDPSRTWGVEALIFSTNVGAGLSREQAGYKIGFLENDTAALFVTADQPLINLLAGEPGGDLMFYFPVSPHRAIVFGPVDRVGPDKRHVSSFEAEWRNNQMFSASDNQTFATERTYLEDLVRIGKVTALG